MNDNANSALLKLALLGEVASELRDARLASGDTDIPVTWLGWFGDVAYRIAMDASETVTKPPGEGANLSS